MVIEWIDIHISAKLHSRKVNLVNSWRVLLHSRILYISHWWPRMDKLRPHTERYIDITIDLTNWNGYWLTVFLRYILQSHLQFSSFIGIFWLQWCSHDSSESIANYLEHFFLQQNQRNSRSSAWAIFVRLWMSQRCRILKSWITLHSEFMVWALSCNEWALN